MEPVILVLFLGAALTMLLLSACLQLGWARALMRRPADWHHSNTGPVPRLGGAALVTAFLCIEAMIGLAWPEVNTGGVDVIVFGSLAMFGLGFWDDLKPLGARRKLFGQIIIAAGVCGCGFSIELCGPPFGSESTHLGVWGQVLAVIWLVGFTNLINLIDGLDGLAGGIGLMVMALFIVINAQNTSLQLLASGMAGALVAFLWFNFPPARLYLGDGGAYLIGFQIGLFSIASSSNGADFGALVAPLFVLALAAVDALLTLLRRGMRGLPLFRADRNHLHHRLITVGFSPRKAVLSIYCLNGLFLVIGLCAYYFHGRHLPLLTGATLLLLLASAGTLRVTRKWFAVHRVVSNSLRLRPQIKYALALSRWFELESRRHSGPHELWPDFIFAASKLGFASVKLTLQDRQRTWHLRDGKPGATRRYSCPNGLYGTIEFTAAACPLNPSRQGRFCENRAFCELRSRGCLADHRVFETVSELLAEAWNKSASQWRRRRMPLRFDDNTVSAEFENHNNAVAQVPFSAVVQHEHLGGPAAKCRM